MKFSVGAFQQVTSVVRRRLLVHQVLHLHLQATQTELITVQSHFVLLLLYSSVHVHVMKYDYVITLF